MAKNENYREAYGGPILNHTGKAAINFMDAGRCTTGRKHKVRNKNVL